MQIIAGAQVFDGDRLWDGMAVMIDGNRIVALCPADQAPKATVMLAGGVLSPAFVDLQVNGGAGLMVGQDTDLDALRRICAVHLRLGTGGILATLITDTIEATEKVISVAIAAEKARVPGFLGLHLEGPHLDPRRAGAHDARLIRPMAASDMARMLEAKKHLRYLKVTLAPEQVSLEQIAALAAAGLLVSLGHSDCNATTARMAIAAGAGCATHLFNAMSQLGNREAGLVGAVLDSDLPCGVIADGFHVSPDVLRIAFRAKSEGVFLVSDCMGFAGSDLTEITLNGRRILRREGRLLLEDGTLAGADLSLSQALRVATQQVGLPAARALAMATRIPADVIGAHDCGRIVAGARADLVHLTDSFDVARMWHAGHPLQQDPQ
jgi:N-acetylglucosamine-6-phosphate deacetylase